MKRHHQETIATGRAISRGNGELGQAALALLGDLQSSVQAGVQALLQRDLPALEQATGQQQRTLQALRATLPAHSAPAAAETSDEQSRRLQESAAQVLYLGRVHAALLIRTQKRLALLSHLFAEPACGYSPPGLATTGGFGGPGPASKGESQCQD